jgi:hypothetical protein
MVEELAKQESNLKQEAFFSPEDELKFLRKVGCLQTDYIASYPRR